jgi:hypothetical protein
LRKKAVRGWKITLGVSSPVRRPRAYLAEESFTKVASLTSNCAGLLRQLALDGATSILAAIQEQVGWKAPVEVLVIDHV